MGYICPIYLFFLKGKCLIGAGFQFRGSAHYYHGWTHGITQAGVVLQKQLRALHPSWQAEESENGPGLGI